MDGRERRCRRFLGLDPHLVRKFLATSVRIGQVSAASQSVERERVVRLAAKDHELPGAAGHDKCCFSGCPDLRLAFA